MSNLQETFRQKEITADNATPIHIVVGDLIVDRFVYGDANRIAAEAPMMVLDVSHDKQVAGGAYNVAAHISSLGHTCLFLAVVGKNFQDYTKGFSHSFDHKCQHRLYTEDRPTSVKTRLIANYKQGYLLRVDRECKTPIQPATEDSILSDVSASIGRAKSLMLVDYRKGVLTQRLSRDLILLANQHGVPVYVDTKNDDLESFYGAYLLKPNIFEFDKIRLRYAPGQSFESACVTVTERVNIKCLVITNGEKGLWLFTKASGLLNFPATPVASAELSGAGDSALAAIAYCLSQGHDVTESCRRANHAAGLMVSKGPEYRLTKGDLA